MIQRLFIFSIISTSFIVAAVFFMPQQQVSACDDRGTFLSFPRWYEYLEVDSECNVSAIRYDGGSGEINLGATVGAILLAVTEILLRVSGIVAVGFIVYGGVQFTMSQGAPDRLQASKQIIMNGIIGLVIAVLAVAIVNLVSNIVVG